MVLLLQIQYVGSGTRYRLEIPYHYEKGVKTKSQKVLGAISYEVKG